jgi:hypothetical protein
MGFLSAEWMHDLTEGRFFLDYFSEPENKSFEKRRNRQLDSDGGMFIIHNTVLINLFIHSFIFILVNF